ncbi:MAG TPA: GSU2403 family nucleotidyltransferase fold protein [Solimonas sp.]|nr:GSU2403 family nucleotidyltransferase fold protein [Solimonas sp.]
MKLDNEQLRILDDTATTYDAWMAAKRALLALGPPLQWKSNRGADYLYEIRGSSGGTSHGPRSAETEARKDAYDRAATEYRATIASTEQRLKVLAAQYRALRLPRVHPALGAIVREADLRGLLGKALIVVGTNAMPVYEIESQRRFLDGLTATQDCDLAWCSTVQLTIAGGPTAAPRPVYALLKAVDSSFTVNMERPFQARNRNGYEVELLLGEEAAATFPPYEELRPPPLPEQDWLMRGTFVSHVLFDLEQQPVRLVVPDPRWMALHKLWIADKPQRNPNKVPKDREQGMRLARAVAVDMHRFPVGDEFRRQVPEILQPYLRAFPQVIAPSGIGPGG